MTSTRYPVSLKVRPWWHDHRVGGRTVLPAVEALLILAAEAVARFPDVDIRSMRDAVFARFLEIPAGATGLEVIVELEALEDGSVHAGLLSRKSFRKMTRLLEHARVHFSGPSTVKGADLPTASSSDFTAEKSLVAEKVYSRYVPFGPACQSIRGTVEINRRQSRTIVQAPVILPYACPVEAVLGSPFPLDGAMHAACVLGQQLVDFVPLPFGFTRRIVHRPTRFGEAYTARAELLSRDDGRLFFDLRIQDEQRVYEEVSGLMMQKIL